MFTAKEYEKIVSFMEGNDEFAQIIRRIMEENQEILSKTSHELRNILTLIRSSIQLIETQHPEVSKFCYWDQVKLDIITTNDLLKEISDYNNVKEMVRIQGDLFELAEQTAAAFEPECKLREVSVHLDAEEEAKYAAKEVFFDNLRMKQVFVNLIKNALEACQQGDSIKIHFGLQCEDKETQAKQLIIKVSDNGVRIPEELLEYIFEPYITSKKDGTGIGLPVVQRILIGHGGDIKVCSEETETSFEFYLPVV